MDNLRFIHDKLQKPAVIDELGLSGKDYFVFTLNRKALIADKENMKLMVKAIIDNAGQTPVIAPCVVWLQKHYRLSSATRISRRSISSIRCLILPLPGSRSMPRRSSPIRET